jgi:cell division septation protein DedD
MAGDGKYPETGPAQNEDEGGQDSPSATSMADSAAAGEAGDRAGPGSTEAPSGVAFGGDRTWVDRDDDSGSGGDSDSDRDGVAPTFLVDSDYGDDFPGAPGAADDDVSGPYDPDPGYAAFANELDDPLADWPAPDTPLDSLPEMRGRGGADDGAPRRDPFADDLLSRQLSDPGGGPEAGFGPPADDFPEAAFFGDPVEHDPADDYSGLAPGEADAAPPGVDRDAAPPTADAPQFASGHEFGTGAGKNDADRSHAPAPQRSAPLVTEQPEPPDIGDGDEQAYRDFDDRAAGADIYADTADVINRGTGADDSEAFVDDFLNGLDDPHDTDLPENRALPMRDAVADADIGAEVAATLPPLRSGAQDAAAADYRAAIDSADDGEADTRSMLEDASNGGSGGTKDDAGLPWGMIAVVAVALLLLAAGGFGVVQQRSSLKAEIRDLQAQLATAVAPEEAAAEREQQRRIEVENESLAAEIAALEAENASLANQLASLEAQLEQQLAAQERAAARESQAATEASARPAQSTAREPTAPAGRAADASGWFVNFGSYAQESIARRWADRLEVSEGRVVVQEARASGQTLYRVRVVGLPTRDAAERIATTLERQHQLPRLWVGRN